MIVVDASAALSGLLNDGPARRAPTAEAIHVPHLVDYEVLSGLRRLVLAEAITAETGWGTLDAWRRVGMTRHPVLVLVERVWRLRESVSADGASYVALAEVLGCALVTSDSRLSRTPGLGCPVTVVPR